MLLLFILIVACNKTDGEKAKTHSPSKQPLQVEIEGQYLGILYPINEKLTGLSTGAVTISKDKDEFVTDVRFSGGAGTTSILHHQNIHVGPRCPNESDDVNQDGVIDAVEGINVYGQTLIPLDDDVNYQHMGAGIFPVADSFGNYIWARVSSFEKIMNDLREVDLDPHDHLIKLGSEKNLNFEGHVVVISGANDSVDLPLTAMGINKLTSHQSLPVACGIISKVNRIFGQTDDGVSDIPIPLGGSVGGTGGYDDGAIVEIPNHSGTSGSATGGHTGSNSTTSGGGVSGNYGEEDETGVPSETTGGVTGF